MLVMEVHDFLLPHSKTRVGESVRPPEVPIYHVTLFVQVVILSAVIFC